MDTVGNFPDLASAQLAQSLLRSAGIEAEIPDQYLAGVGWQMTSAIKGVRLTVPSEDAEAARALLQEQFTGVEENVTEEEAPETCPACGSDDVTPPGWKRRLKAAVIVFPPLLLLYGAFSLLLPNTICPSCGHGWRR